ncbi:uncharacterized protein LOC126783017 [Argentina anserina]|uniref:uncharacterized protein LOC126783017 n=1 Tax=Argentina anserina TaxID=57926 RepID=UPI0021764052|nr:uncharacterized protein LOC126783017 [Potentilla anserina]XP_050364354.1 uncharacterized protein LOC126783017 [Potentilla anserina]
MLKKQPSRNTRTKGIRVKHVLQIVLLLGVCVWLIYQLKHSFDKKAALAENDSKTSIRTETKSEILKLGRKDLPHKDVTTHLRREEEEEEESLREEEEEEKHEVEDEKHEAEEREEEDPKHEVEDIEEEIQKHEGAEQEEEQNKDEDPEEEGEKAGDEEIDENDSETKEGGEEDHKENLIDEEKEREDGGDEKEVDRNEDEEREDREEIENSSDDQDNEGDDKNAHEAREEHYKADDASSAVTHDTQVISTETEKVSSEMSTETSETSGDEDGNQHNMRLVDSRTAENDTLSVPASEEKLEGNSSNPVANSLLDGKVKTQTSDLPEAENNSTVVSSEVGKNFTEVNQATSSHKPNETETISESAQSQNAEVDGTATREDSTEKTVVVEQTNNTVSAHDRLDSTATVSSHEKETNVSEKTLISDGTADVDNSSRSSTIKQTMDATENEHSTNEDASKNEESANEDATTNEESNDQDATTTEESDVTNESSRVDEGSDAVQDDPIDSADSHISEDEQAARTDLDTLPEIQTEEEENGEAAAE